MQDDEINQHSQLAEKLKEQMMDQEEVCLLLVNMHQCIHLSHVLTDSICCS